MCNEPVNDGSVISINACTGRRDGNAATVRPQGRGGGGMDKKSAFVGQLETSRSAERDARRGLAVNPGTADAFLSLCLTGIRPKHFHKSLSETRLIGPHSTNIKRAAVCSFPVDDRPTLHSGAERRRFPTIPGNIHSTLANSVERYSSRGHVATGQANR